MPFVTQEHRMSPDFGIPGDRCFVHYKRMVEKWTYIPRWTTADRLFGEVLLKSLKYALTFQFGQLRALLLAWQVFFIKYMMPYENKQEKKNGTI